MSTSGINIAEYFGCTGRLSRDAVLGRDSLDVVYDVIVEPSGRIRIKLRDQPLTSENFWVHQFYAGNSGAVEMLTLDGSTGDGLSIHSDTVILNGVTTGGFSTTPMLGVTASASQVTLVPASLGDGPGTVEYWVRNLYLWGQAIIDADVGDVEITGSIKPDEQGHADGRVAIRQKSGPVNAEWLVAADKGARRVLDILSFASGCFLRPYLRQAFSGERCTRIEFFAGKSPTPHQPPLHFMDGVNTIPRLVRAYNDDLIAQTGLNVAIEWHVMPHLYNEARFIAQMTAVEHLIHVFTQGSPDSTYIPKRLFHDKVSVALVNALEQQMAAPELAGSRTDATMTDLTRNIKGINRRSLGSNLRRMLTEYRVPLDGLDTRLGELIQVRNDIVHQGLYQAPNEEARFGEHVAAAQELLRRIVLAVLGFEGRYTTWFQKIEDRDFRRPSAPIHTA